MNKLYKLYNILRTTAAVLALVVAAPLIHVEAQQQPGATAPDITARNLTLQLANPPAAVPNCSVQSLNGPGTSSYFYWIVVEYQIGNSNVFGPCTGATTFKNTQDGLTNFAKIAFPSMPGTGPGGVAVEYDVLRTTTPMPPTGTSNVAVNVGNFYPASGSINDAFADGTLSAYTVNTFDPSTVTTSLSNVASGAGTSALSGGASGINFAGPIISSSYFVAKGAPAAVVGAFGWDSSDSFFKVSNGVTPTSVPKTFRLAADYTNSTTSMTNAFSNLGLLSVNTNYVATCDLYYQGAATAGLQVQFTGPSTPTNVIYGAVIQTNTSNAQTNGVAVAFSSPVPAAPVAVGTAATNFVATITGTFEIGAVSGILRLQAASAAAAQLTIKKDSKCTVTQVQ